MSVLFLIIEHIYFKYLRKWLGKLFGGNRWCNLLSLSVGNSMQRVNGKPQVDEKHVCKSDLCGSVMENTEAELNAAHKQIEMLEKQLEKIDWLSIGSQADKLSLFSKADKISLHSNKAEVLQSKSKKDIIPSPEDYPVIKKDRVSLEAWKKSINCVRHRDIVTGETWRRKYEEIETVL